MKKRFLSILAALFIFTAAACASPAATPLPTAIPTSTTIPVPTTTPTSTPTPASTPEPEKPSVPSGLRPENAATQTLENGVWTVKNADGKVTATWNAETKSWDYVVENIKVEQIIVGYTGDQAAIQPYLDAPRPADKPEDHFIDPATGERVPYGVGTNKVSREMIGMVGDIKYTDTPVYVRFLGVAPLSTEFSARIFELPGIDRSIIIVVETGNVTFIIAGTPNDNTDLNANDYTWPRSWSGDSGIALANKNLINRAAILFVSTDKSSQMDPKNPLYDDFSRSTTYAQTLLKFLQGDSSVVPIEEDMHMTRAIVSYIVFRGTDVSHLPK